MNILSLSRKEVQDFVDSGMMRKENLKHYDICKAVAQGMKPIKAAEEFNVSDDSRIRKIVKEKCPDCPKNPRGRPSK